MALPQPILNLLNTNAQKNGAKLPSENDDLFESGALDSFTLVDLVSTIEQNCSIKIPDGDVNPANFQTITVIENYIQTHST